MMHWPADLPREEIVCCRLERTGGVATAAIWAMLSEEEIARRQRQTVCQQFLFSPHPHPLVLWGHGLFTRGLRPRWLRTFLDLKQPADLAMLHCLIAQASYTLVLFGLESGQALHTQPQKIDPRQRELMRVWLNLSLQSAGHSPNLSRQALIERFEKLKPQVQAQMEVFYRTPQRTYQSRALTRA